MSRLNVVFLLVFVGVLVWVTMFQPTVVEQIQRGAMTFFAPVTENSEKLAMAAETVEEDALTPSEMKAKLASLERERDSLRLEVLQLDEIIFENNELRKALQYKERVPLSLVPGRVMSRKPSNWYNTIVIDKGKKDGVVADSPVIVAVDEKAALVGKVSDVIGDKTAVVLLLTDEMCQVSAKLENTKDEGIIMGQRGT
ncbi:MAG: rod shape-determining protein MreC, partial [Methylococcales bacterium]|nr:rod shape-determining protein MreC [Methylococcales bacterium]